ncbi:Serine/threonine-protein kinase STY8 [Ananas comosus]|uniref:Serine/threonine-protein kinase STY8 n=1 Tax=Ananas comosus TaxID=4615 RepID=A0A199UW45_ANACO|nr:Serine/threonine-protein kinase STY8 [Ananas comosus]
MDAAFGMEYLHEKNIVYFDLKSHNFFMNMRDPHRPVCKVDVYSFGSSCGNSDGGEPYENLRSDEIIAGIIKGDLRPKVPSWCDPAWKSLMERCWSSDPEARPSFSEIAKELRDVAESMNIKY